MTDRHVGGQLRRGVRLRERLLTCSLGLASGMGVNSLSSDLGYRGVAIAAAVVAILAGSNWVRRLPSAAPLIRIVSRGLLAGAFIAAIVAVIRPSWEGPATIVATLLTAAAVLIPTDLVTVGKILSGAAVIGSGVALIGVALPVLRSGHVLPKPAVIGSRVAFMGFGIAVISLGIAGLRSGYVLPGVTVVGFGVAVVGFGVAVLLRDGRVLAGVAVIEIGAAVVGFGIVNLYIGDVPRGVALIGQGVAAVGFGVAILRGSHLLPWVAVVGFGVAAVSLGGTNLVRGNILSGVAIIAGGIAAVGFGLIVLHRIGTFVPILSWLVSLTRAPRSEALPHTDPTACEPDDSRPDPPRVT